MTMVAPNRQGPVPTIRAPRKDPGTVHSSIHSLNHYDGHRTICTCDDKVQAARLSGHSWNIISNSDQHEVYLQMARSDDHYVDQKGATTSHWFEKKRRIDLDDDGIPDVVDSSNVQEVMWCPPTAGKEAAHLRSRQAKQLHQASAPLDYALNTTRRSQSAAPPTPSRSTDLDRMMQFQHRTRDIPSKATPRVINKLEWTPRRGEQRFEPQPPDVYQMFRTVDQLRCESHMDVKDDNFAHAVNTSRTLGATGSSTLSGAITQRSVHVGQADKPPRPFESMTRHSKSRVEAFEAREISAWTFKKDKLQKDDHYHLKPMQQPNGSSVKFDIISNERRQFWY